LVPCTFFLAFSLALAEPAKEVTGGAWYRDQELDEALIAAVRDSVLAIVEAQGPITPSDVTEQLPAPPSGVKPWSAADIAQLMDVCVYDGLLEYSDGGAKRLALLAAPSKPVFGIHDGAGAGAGAADFDDEGDDFQDGGDAADDEGGPTSAAAADAARLRARWAASGVRLLEYDDTGIDAGGDDDEGHGYGSDGEGGGALRRRYVRVRPTAHEDHLTGVPCGVCPVFEKCVPGGVISPTTCVYFSTWLEF
jgi:hypothetical protein